MRQVGFLPQERDAHRFLAFLITQNIEATCERENDSWVVWIHDEDSLPQARQLLEDYRLNPDDPRYQTAQRVANQRLQEALAKRQEAQKNVVEMSGKWRSSSGGANMVGRNAPITFALIAIALVVAGLTQLGASRDSGTYQALSFVEFNTGAKIPPAFRDIQQGQVWRLITPIFLHFGVMHLVFNCYAMFVVATQVEERRGSYFFVLLLIVSAIVSNVLQAVLQGPAFGGLSGVLYAYLGYVWIAMASGNRERYSITPSTIYFCLGWLVLCILRDIPGIGSSVAAFVPGNVANVAHVAGLVVGMAFATLMGKK